MRLIFDSVDELRDFLHFSEQLGTGLARHESRADPYRDAAPVSLSDAGPRVEGKPSALAAPYGDAVAAMDDSRTPEDAAAAAPEVDRDGVRYDERIHAPSRAIKADGTWRMKRNVDQKLVDTVLAEQHEQNRAIVQAAQADEPKVEEANDDALVTETHALPVDDPDAVNAVAAEVADTGVDAAAAEADTVHEAMPAGISIDFPSLVADAQAMAGDLSGDMVNVLNVSREFLAATSHETFAALKAHVAPGDDGQGKALPTMSPGERRLLEAAMSLHLKARTE